MEGFDWSEEDHIEFNKEEYLDHGKWTFYKAEDGKFEAIMDGLYMHVFLWLPVKTIPMSMSTHQRKVKVYMGMYTLMMMEIKE